MGFETFEGASTLRPVGIDDQNTAARVSGRNRKVEVRSPLKQSTDDFAVPAAILDPVARYRGLAARLDGQDGKTETGEPDGNVDGGWGPFERSGERASA